MFYKKQKKEKLNEIKKIIQKQNKTKFKKI